MCPTKLPAEQALRVFCLEDNPLILFHLEHMIEDLGHQFVGSLDNFGDLAQQMPAIKIDCALIDIDLADGATGPAAAAWFLEKGIPSVFVTGQEDMAARHPNIAVGIVSKPVADTELAAALVLLGKAVAKRAAG